MTSRFQRRPNSFSMSPWASLTQVGRPWLHWPECGVTSISRSKRVHLGDRQDPPGADRAVAGDRRGDMVEPVAQRQRGAESRPVRRQGRAAGRGRRSCRAAPGWRGPASRSARSARSRARARPARAPPPRAGRNRARPARPRRGAAAPGARPRRRATPRASARAPAARARHAGRRSPARPRPRRRYRSPRPARARRRAGRPAPARWPVRRARRGRSPNAAVRTAR